MRKTWKTSAMMLCALSLAFSLAACGASGNNNSANSASNGSDLPADSKATASGKPADDSKPVTINVLTQSVEPKDLVEKFEQANPSIHVDWEQVDTANISQTMKTRIAAGGENLDIMTPQKADFQPMADSGVFLDLTGSSFLTNYDQPTLDAGTVDGKVVGVPLTQQAYLVWYNKDLFDKYQLAEPQNWDEFLKVCETLKQNGVAPIVLAGKEDWVVDVFAGLAYSGLFSQEPHWLTDAAAGKVKWTDPGSLEALQRIKTLTDKGYLLQGALGTGYDQAYQAFYQGKAAMEVNGVWSIDLIVQNKPSFNFGAFVPPGNKAGDPLKDAFVPGNTISISAQSKHPEESKKFLAFLSQPENASMLANDLKQFPSAKGASANFDPATKLLDPIFAADKSEMLHAQLSPTTNSVFGKQIQMILGGETTPEKAAQAIQDAQDKDVK